MREAVMQGIETASRLNHQFGVDRFPSETEWFSDTISHRTTYREQSDRKAVSRNGEIDDQTAPNARDDGRS